MAWLLLTLLTRSTPAVIASITVECPSEVDLLDRITPFPAEDGTLLSTLRHTSDLAGPTASPVVAASVESRRDPDRERPQHIRMVLNIRPHPDDQPGAHAHSPRENTESLHVTGAGWLGAINTSPTGFGEDLLKSCCPVGPYIAACLAAGHAFLAVRAIAHQTTPVQLDGWSLQIAHPGADAPTGPEALDIALDHVLAGVGAVGTALLLTLWATPGVSGLISAVDADGKGIEDTNLNRCLVFTIHDLGKPKAETAASALNDPEGLAIVGQFGHAEDHVGPRTHLISAVDTPQARAALQDRYPASAVQASTRDLRVEMLRVDPAHRAPCLRCYNEPVEPVSDQELRLRTALATDHDQLAVHAQALQVAPDQILDWLHHGGCGTLGDRMLERLRAGTGDPAEFSVGFASVLAGVLLAGQVVKDTRARRLSAEDPVETTAQSALDAQRPRFVLNLTDPRSRIAGSKPYQRDHDCPACQGPRLAIWLKRWTG